MTSILIVRADGVIRIDGAVPVAPTFLETVEHLFRTLDVRPHDDERCRCPGTCEGGPECLDDEGAPLPRDDGSD